MKIAIPVVNKKRAKMVRNLGFLAGGLPSHNFTVDFLDNGFYQGEITKYDFYKKAKKDRPEFVVVPDNNLEIDFPPYFKNLKKIYPIHKIKDLKKVEKGSWVAYPRGTPDIEAPGLIEYIANTQEYKRWFLGFTEAYKKYIPLFDGLDTSICAFYANISKIWYSWGRNKQVDGEYSEKIRESLTHFKREIEKQLQQTLLEEHL